MVGYTLAMAAATPSALPAWSVRLVAEFDTLDRSAQELAAGLTAEQFNWRPSPDKWSIGQCLEHLCITNEAYVPAMRNALAGQPARDVEEITPGWFSRWFLRSFVEPSPTSKQVSAPKKILPAASVDLSVVDRLHRSHQAAREFVRQAADRDVNRIRFRNPFLPGLRFTIGTGLLLLPSHGRRHLLQAERVKQSGVFPWQV